MQMHKIQSTGRPCWNEELCPYC